MRFLNNLFSSNLVLTAVPHYHQGRYKYIVRVRKKQASLYHSIHIISLRTVGIGNGQSTLLHSPCKIHGYRCPLGLFYWIEIRYIAKYYAPYITVIGLIEIRSPKHHTDCGNKLNCSFLVNLFLLLFLSVIVKCSCVVSQYVKIVHELSDINCTVPTVCMCSTLRVPVQRAAVSLQGQAVTRTCCFLNLLL